MKFIFKIHENKIGDNILFLDRDGVVIEDTGYPIEIKKLKIKEFSINNLVHFKEKNNLSVCGFVTNQSGVSRGYFSEEKFWETHDYIIGCCNSLGLVINFTCVNFFTKDDYFRKPNNGMLETAINYFGAKKDKSFMVGDKDTDMQAAKKSNLNFKNITYFNNKTYLDI